VTKKYTLPKSQRVKSKADFEGILAGRRESRGPLTGIARTSPTGKCRLGIRIGRRCGSAPVRNRIKRMIREAYRLMQHDWPVAVDLIVLVKPHDPLLLADYQRILSTLMVKLSAGLARSE
jgi:ribonuclease P protein component